MADNSQFQDLKARIQSYENLKKEFYKLDIDEDEKIDEYIKKFQELNDEFQDALSELNLAVSNITGMTDSEINEFINFARSLIGKSFVWGTEGDEESDQIDQNGPCFDCSGLLTYVMKEMELMPKNAARLSVGNIPFCGFFNEIPWSVIKRGDILCNNSMTHVSIYEGNNQIIHATNSAPYPKGGVKEDTLNYTGRAFRIKGYGVE